MYLIRYSIKRMGRMGRREKGRQASPLESVQPLWWIRVMMRAHTMNAVVRFECGRHGHGSELCMGSF